MFETIISSFIELILNVVGSLGYLGIFILMTIESTIIPLPAELILVPAGWLAHEGSYSLLFLIIVSTLGSLAGALINYFFALHLGRRAVNHLVRKYESFLYIKHEHLVKAEKYFENHGAITTFIGRLIPALRSFVSVPAGFSRMNLVGFCIFTSLGAGIWNTIIIVLGYFLGKNYDSISQYLSTATIIILVISALAILSYYFLLRRKRAV